MVQDARHFKFSSDYPMGYFIYKNEVSLLVSAHGTDEITIKHNLPCTPLLVGYWSEYNDFRISNDVGIDRPGLGTYLGLDVGADGENIYIEGSSGRDEDTMLYVRLWAYAPPDFDGNVPSVTDSTNYYFNTDYNYLEIAKSGVVPEGSSGVIEINHDLGYIPQCRTWGELIWNGHRCIKPESDRSVDMSSWSPTTEPGYGCVDSSKLYLAGGPYKTYYHIYTSEG